MSDTKGVSRKKLEQLYRESLALNRVLGEHAAEQQALIQLLQQQLAAQQALIQKLQDQLARDSHNSGKPPSSDGLKKGKRKSLRRSGQRPRGGQRGHKVQTLLQVAEPDHILLHRHHACPHCQTDLEVVAAKKHVKRQVVGIPPAGIDATHNAFLDQPFIFPLLQAE